MPRRDPHFLEALAKLPWPFGVAVGCIAWVLGFYVAPALLEDVQSPFAAGIALALNQGALGLLVWMVAAACWAAALVSILGRGRRKRLLEAQNSLADIRELNWREFEQLVGEAFRRQGFTVTEMGQGGADGGVDLLLQRNGLKQLVQCKQWKQKKVGVSVVREQFGLLTHHGAERVIIVSVGAFTPDAMRFVEGKPIDLISGADLVELIRSVRAPVVKGVASSLDSASSETLPAVALASLACPRCGSEMKQRTARASGAGFWGCSRFPACRGTRML